MPQDELTERGRALLDLCRRKGLKLAAAARSGRLILEERKYGNIGRAKVRRASVIDALTMLGELAASEEVKRVSSQG